MILVGIINLKTQKYSLEKKDQKFHLRLLKLQTPSHTVSEDFGQGQELEVIAYLLILFIYDISKVRPLCASQKSLSLLSFLFIQIDNKNM